MKRKIIIPPIVVESKQNKPKIGFFALLGNEAGESFVLADTKEGVRLISPDQLEEQGIRPIPID